MRARFRREGLTTEKNRISVQSSHLRPLGFDDTEVQENVRWIRDKAESEDDAAFDWELPWYRIPARSHSLLSWKTSPVFGLSGPKRSVRNQVTESYNFQELLCIVVGWTAIYFGCYARNIGRWRPHWMIMISTSKDRQQHWPTKPNK